MVLLSTLLPGVRAVASVLPVGLGRSSLLRLITGANNLLTVFGDISGTGFSPQKKLKKVVEFSQSPAYTYFVQ